MYDDDTISLKDEATEATDALTFSNSDASVGNASCSELDLDSDLEDKCFAGEEDKPQFNYLGPKVIRPSVNEKPVTILTANTIGTIRIADFSEYYWTQVLPCP